MKHEKDKKQERVPHELSVLHRSFSAMRVMAFDVETKTDDREAIEQPQRFDVATSIFGIINRDGCTAKQYRQVHDNPGDLCSTVISRTRERHVLVVFSCNIWFDLRTSNLLVNLLDKGWKVRTAYSKQMCTIIKMVNGRKTIRFLNINQLIPGSVKKYGELIGLPKLEFDFENGTKEEEIKYCMRDTEIIFRIFEYWTQFIVKYRLGSFSFTLASQAFTAFRSNYMNVPIHIHTNQVASDLERESYFGGRTEIFHQGKIPCDEVFYLDVNSMYPYIMKTKQLPHKLYCIIDKPTFNELFRAVKKHFVIAKVLVSTEHNYYPTRHEGKLLFPTGMFWTVLCGDELQMAIDSGDLIDIDIICCYKKRILFAEYIDTFYNLRKKLRSEGNDIMQHCSKIIMNSLYGKFGQRSDEIILEEDMDEIRFDILHHHDIDEHRNLTELILGNKRLIFMEGCNEHKNAFPAICSSITSFARSLLLRYIRKAGQSNCYYCDTDSIFTNRQGYDNLREDISETELGKLGLDKSGREVVLYAPKDYVWDGKATIKGVRRDGKVIDKCECDACRKLQVSNGKGVSSPYLKVFENLKFPSMRSDLHGGMAHHYMIYKIKKHLHRTYTKGTVSSSGRIIPYKLSL